MEHRRRRQQDGVLAPILHPVHRRIGGLEKALQRYVVFVLAVSVLYFVSAMLVLTDWLRNAWAALAVTLVLVAAAPVNAQVVEIGGGVSRGCIGDSSGFCGDEIGAMWSARWQLPASLNSAG